MKTIDLTGYAPIIGGKKEIWVFRCASCRYQAIFFLWKGEGMSTSCERCGGDMERIKEIKND
jgi:rRNA maturation endonuclease Nob1